MKSKLLKDIYNPKNNSFTLVGIILSLMIILFHSYPLFYGTSTNKTDIFTSLFNGESVGTIGVASFFIISGFMITNSIKRSKNISGYVFKRIKKIFPPMIFILLFSALVISPVLSSLPKFIFLKKPSIYMKYIIDNTFLIKNTIYGIGDVFINNPYPIAINGSLWTMKHQMFMYIYMIPVYLLFIKKQRNDMFDIFFGTIFAIAVVNYSGVFNTFYNNIANKNINIGILNELYQFIRLIYYFSVGIFMNIHSDRIVYNKKYILLSIIIILITFRTPVFNIFTMILLPYVLIYICCRKNNRNYKDISYYIYLSAFPLQQVVIHYLHGKINIYTYIALNLIVTVLFSYGMYLLFDVIIKKIKIGGSK